MAPCRGGGSWSRCHGPPTRTLVRHCIRCRRIVRLVVDLDDKGWARGEIKVDDLSQTYVVAAVARPLGDQYPPPETYKALSPLGVARVGGWRHGVTGEQD